MSTQSNMNIDDDMSRVLLCHRFGVVDKCLSPQSASTQELSFAIAIEELKKSHAEFLSNEENVDKITHFINNILSQHQPMLTDTEVRVEYKINVNELMDVVTHELFEVGTKEYEDKMSTRVQNREIYVVPVKVADRETSLNCEECEIKGVVLFGDKFLKVNRGNKKSPSVTLYKIQKFDLPEAIRMIGVLMDSFAVPLDRKNWDKELNEVFNLEKTNKVIKKEHAIQNCAWLTSKMFIYCIVYGVIYQSLKELSAKDIVSNKIAVAVAEAWYKFFTVDDRNRAILNYLVKYNVSSTESPNTVNRVKALKALLSSDTLPENHPDNELLNCIYLKSLNWLLAEYLNKGEIGLSKQLLKEEEDNKQFNPLYYAARNGKISIAELLANQDRYVNEKDKEGNTPLMIAVKWGQLDICKILVNHQKRNELDLKASNYEGSTVLHLAVENDHRDIAEFLLKKEPSLLIIKNKKEETPLEIALNNEQNELAKFLSQDKSIPFVKGEQK